MGTIIKKKIKGINYYYYVESKRIDGKSKYVNQKYLGSADKILKMVNESGKSLQDQVLYAHEVTFGSVALLYDIAMRLDIVSIIDEVVPKRNQGASVGMYILTAAINRAVSPASTNGLKEWYEKTALPHMTGLKSTLFTPQNFWNNTDITVEQLRTIEDRIFQKSIRTFDINTGDLIYDATNFFTYIDTMNPSGLAKRGHDKAKRNDLKTVGLALLVTPDFSVPVLSETYPGNRGDSTQFSDMMEQLKLRYRAIVGKDAQITIVFDRGNNSESNLDLLESEGLGFHYVGGLKKNQVTELFAVSKSNYKPLSCPEDAPEKYKSLTTYRMRATVLGREATTVIVYNPELEKGQLQGIQINIEKTKSELLEIQGKLLKRSKGELKKGKKPTFESVSKAVSKILDHREYMDDIFEYEILEKDSHIFLTFSDSEDKLNVIREEQLGKTALFTDRSDMSDYEIISAYRSAWHVESSFKQMKDTGFLTVRPIFHWTDQRIAVHIFVCVLAYRLCSLLRKELHRKGIECSINQYLKSMNSINRVTTFYGDIKKPKKVEAFISGDELSSRIEESYKLQEKYYC